jgi:hypothetical protein
MEWNHELILINYALIRSILQYCSIVWHNNLPAYLAVSIERVQKRALNIILHGRSYREALSQLHCSRLDERRDALSERTIKQITDGNRLFYLLPQTRENVNYDLRIMLTIGHCSDVELIVFRKSFYQV